MSDNFDDSSSDVGPVSSFQSLAAEGDIHAKLGDFRKAAESYTKALTMRNNEKNVLVARSRCYLSLGDHRLALDDVEAALKEDKDYFKARYQKAEVLYAKGDFEMALVCYHRGHSLRPELEDFRLGIQKAREAIDNSIGSQIKPRDYGQDKKSLNNRPTLTSQQTRSSSDRETLATAVSSTQEAPVTADSRDQRSAARQLLGELFVDKEYFDQFLIDKEFQTSPNDQITQKIQDALVFLDNRIDFWRQQKPIYARMKSQTAQPRLKSVK